MKFKFYFRHVDVSESLKEYSQDHFERAAGRFLLKECLWQVYFRFDQHECQVQVDANTPFGHFKATANGENFYQAVDEVAERLGRQFQKVKEKNKNHKRMERAKEGRMGRLSETLVYDGDSSYKKSS